MDSEIIANKFRDYYANIFVDSGANFAAVSEFEELRNSRPMSTSCLLDNNLPNVDVESIEKCISALKTNRGGSTIGDAGDASPPTRLIFLNFVRPPPIFYKLLRLLTVQ